MPNNKAVFCFIFLSFFHTSSVFIGLFFPQTASFILASEWIESKRRAEQIEREKKSTLSELWLMNTSGHPDRTSGELISESGWWRRKTTPLLVTSEHGSLFFLPSFFYLKTHTTQTYRMEYQERSEWSTFEVFSQCRAQRQRMVPRKSLSSASHFNKDGLKKLPWPQFAVSWISISCLLLIESPKCHPSLYAEGVSRTK